MALILELKVIPGSGKSLCKLDKANMLKCYLKSQPEQGKANKELIKLLAKSLQISEHLMTIVSGTTARNKRIKIQADITYEAVLALLGIEKQQTLF